MSTCRIGVGGPVGSGKTALIEAITPRLMDKGMSVLIITNDIVTTEDAKHVRKTLKGVLMEDRIIGVETGACPHTAVREDPSMNIAAVEEMEAKFPDADVVLIESGGDNLTLTRKSALRSSIFSFMSSMWRPATRFRERMAPASRRATSS